MKEDLKKLSKTYQKKLSKTPNDKFEQHIKDAKSKKSSLSVYDNDSYTDNEYLSIIQELNSFCDYLDSFCTTETFIKGDEIDS